MKLDHFSHEHPLIITNEDEGPAYNSEEDMICSCCRTLIKDDSSPAYSCSQGCAFFLHKTCAKLSRQIKNHMHFQHHLDLGTGDLECDACDRYCKGFTYNCEGCEFNICIPCSNNSSNILKHGSHEHPLLYVPRRSLFRCDACGEKEKEDYSYKCMSCPFWIHKSCALLESSTQDEDSHNHVLNLAYFLPPQYSKFNDPKCDICHDEITPWYWVYHCAKCRFVAHLSCVHPPQTNSSASSSSSVRDGESETENEEDESSEYSDTGRAGPCVPVPDFNIFGSDEDIEREIADDDTRLPLPRESVDLISHLLQKIYTEEIEDERQEINHFSHNHPLVVESKHNEEEKLCDGCVQPILIGQYYTCTSRECVFFLHQSCAELPAELLSHKSHPSHPLRLLAKVPDLLGVFKCSECSLVTNGFAYACDPCGFRLDVKCASLLLKDTVAHQAHPHQLLYINYDCDAEHGPGNTLRFEEDDDSTPTSYRCNACDNYHRQGSMWKCGPCKFFVQSGCLVLPRTARHRFDKHPLKLGYPPFDDHPEEFLCDACEKYLNPKAWLYHCSKCDQSFHTSCLPRTNSHSNLKFVGSRFFEQLHRHPLAFFPQTKKTKCDNCRSDSGLPPLFECDRCNVGICLTCLGVKCLNFLD